MNTAPQIACPCCASLTLAERGAFEICNVCDWEDDGQDDGDAGDVRGGPNGDLSLTKARQYFRDFGTTVPDFVSPDALFDFVRLITKQVEENGLRVAGARLSKMNSPAYTTGSEWLGEIGQAIREGGLEREPSLPLAVQRGIRRIMRTVRRTWPEL